MATMQHPIFSDLTKTVPDDQVKAWEKQGWTRKNAKTAATAAAEPQTKPAAKKTTSRTRKR